MRGLLRLLLLPAAVLGVAVENEICPADRAETKICSARQDFVVVVDRSYSRRPYFEEFKLFLKGFFDYIGLDEGNAGPRVSLVSFAGRIIGDDSEWNNAEGHALDTTFIELSGSRSAVLRAVDDLPDPAATCTETGGCTCISCGAEVAWARIPEAARAGAATPRPSLPLAAPSPRQPHALSPSAFLATSAGRGGQPPTLIFLTDGDQNPWYGGESGPGNAEALSTTARLKAEGARLVMVGYGDGVNYEQMDAMASEPSTTCAGALHSGLHARSGSVFFGIGFGCGFGSAWLGLSVAPALSACSSPTSRPLDFFTRCRACGAVSR